MNFEKHQFDKRNYQQKTIEEKLRPFFAEIFNNNKESEKRQSELYRRMQIFLKTADDNRLSPEEIKKIKYDLEATALIPNQEEFISSGLKAIGPLINWRKEDEASFEKKQRENMTEVTGFTPLNDLLSYDQEKDNIHIHVYPAETLSLGKKMALIRDGLSKLAQILTKNPQIKEITAVSWIVAANPGLMEKLGFSLENSENEKKYNDEQGRQIKAAHISREDFLNKY